MSGRSADLPRDMGKAWQKMGILSIPVDPPNSLNATTKCRKLIFFVGGPGLFAA
jgi:hypothetical protein